MGHLKLIFQHSYILISMENQTYLIYPDLNLNFQGRYSFSFVKIKNYFKISHQAEIFKFSRSSPLKYCPK